MVHVRVADMVIRFGLELGFNLGKLVLQHREIYGDVVLLPETGGG